MVSTAEPPKEQVPQDILADTLCSKLAQYLDEQQIEQVRHCYQFGAEAHEGVTRASGEAYICHPLSVAIILANMHLDINGIMAAILHDVIEDTEINKTDLQEIFGEEVAELVDGVTKLTIIDHKSRAEAQAENVRKMFLAMTRDLRVIMVKLADRLHNMRTLGAIAKQKKYRKAKETLEIYAPIAHRLGMNKVRHELELLGFKAMHPMRFRIMDQAVKKARGNRREVIEMIEASITNHLQTAGLQCEVLGREKNVYSIYQKMLNKKISFAEVFDVYAFRIFCDQLDTCYRILGLVHNLYKPVPGRFKDYIALPKINGYQSLHTVLIGPFGEPIEIQIRTHQMHQISESGIAAHWLYKHDDVKNSKYHSLANEWIRDLMEINESAGNSLDFIDNLKIELFPQETFVFTPQGGIIKLPRGATVVDFAYAVHTDIGNSCVSARIDKRLVPLHSKLENGQTVEIITSSWTRANPAWLNYVVTAKARSGIRSFLKHFKQKEAKSLGLRLLNNELLAMGLSLDEISDHEKQQLLQNISLPSFDRLLEEIGLGNRMPFLVAKSLCQDDQQTAFKLNDNSDLNQTPLIIKGTEGMVVNLAKCCHPIPGDPIVGYFNPGKGIVIHHLECKNSHEGRKKTSSWLNVEWGDEMPGDFTAEIRLEIINQRGSLAEIAHTISSMQSNIENINLVDQDDQIAVDLITLTVRDRKHLAKIFRRLKKLSIVTKITRTKA